MVLATKEYTMKNASAVPRANAKVVQTEMRQAAVVRKNLGIFEYVPHAANGMYQRHGTIVVHFAAQAINVHVNHVGCRIDSHAPNMIEDHGASDHPPGIAAEIFQQ